jgi:hypothetical protein
MKGYKTKIFFSISLILATFSCTSYFGEMNTDPNTLNQVPYKSLMTNAEISILKTYNTVIDFAVSWTRYNVRDVYVHNDRYEYAGDDTNFNYYSGHLKNLKIAINLATAAGDDNTLAVLNILRVYAFQNLTDWFGDIPYSEALMADDADNPNIYAKYDSQASIYADLITKLKAANAMIEPTANIGSADVIFDGDMMMWKRFCNSLLLRVYMRMSIVDAATAKAGIEQIAGDPGTYPIIDSNEHAAFKFWLPDNSVYRSPYYMNPVNALTQEYATSAFMVSFLKDRDDARLPVYAEPSATSGEYVGLPLGTLGFNTPDLSIMGVAEFRSDDSPTRMMRYSEVLFILAEAAANNWNVGMTAKEAYEAAITASFEEYGLSIGDYLSNPLVDFDGGTPQKQLIGDQKWCALYPDGTQGWAEVRRTGYPTYVDTTEPVGSLFPGLGVIKRMPYPYSEAINNTESLANAMAAQPGIVSEKFGAGVWWDVN